MQMKLRNPWVKDGYIWSVPEHKWFAWFPVQIKYREWVWLETLWRTGRDGDGYGDWWEYRRCE